MKRQLEFSEIKNNNLNTSYASHNYSSNKKSKLQMLVDEELREA